MSLAACSYCNHYVSIHFCKQFKYSKDLPKILSVQVTKSAVYTVFRKCDTIIDGTFLGIVMGTVFISLQEKTDWIGTRAEYDFVGKV